MLALKNIAILFFFFFLVIILYETNKSESFNPLPEACIICPTSSSGTPIYDDGKTCHAKIEDVNGGELGITRFANNKSPEEKNQFTHNQSLCTYIGCKDTSASNYTGEFDPKMGKIYQTSTICKYNDITEAPTQAPTPPPSPEYEECNPSFNEIASCSQNNSDKTLCENSYENMESGIGNYCTFTPGESSLKSQAEINPGKVGKKNNVGCYKANSGGTMRGGLRAFHIGAAGPANNDGKQILSLSNDDILEKCKKVAERDYGKKGYSGITVNSTGPWFTRGCDIFHKQDKLLETIPRDGKSCYVNPDYMIEVNDSAGKCEPSGNMCNTPTPPPTQPPTQPPTPAPKPLQIPEPTIQQKDIPVISLNGPERVKINLGNGYVEQIDAVTAHQMIDGEKVDLTHKLQHRSNVNTRVAGDYEVKYFVKDDSNPPLETEIYRYVEIIDKTKPILEIFGDNPIQMNINTKYTDLGARATDNGIDISKNIKTNSNVDTGVVGEYSVIYTVNDGNGNETSKTRTVIITDSNEKLCGEPVWEGGQCEDMPQDMCKNNSHSVLYENTPYHCQWSQHSTKCEKGKACGTRPEIRPPSQEPWLQRLAHMMSR